METNLISLYETPYDDTDKTYLELISIEDENQDPFLGMQNSELKKSLASFLEKLPERKQLLLKMRFGMHNGRQMTLEEIGDKMKLFRERVHQLESQALGRIRKMKGITILYDYLT